MTSQETQPFFPEEPREGVVATLKRAEAGRVRLTLDDVSHQPGVGVTAWRHDRLFTHKDFDANALRSLTLSREELALIGENLVIRLLAQMEGKSLGRGYVAP